jgi:hypothetical protein
MNREKFSISEPKTRPVSPQSFSALLVVGHHSAKKLPEGGRMIVTDEMTEFMGDHVIH